MIKKIILAAFIALSGSGLASAKEACVETMDARITREIEMAKKNNYKMDFLDEISLKDDGEKSWKKFSETLQVMKPTPWPFDRAIYAKVTTPEGERHAIMLANEGCYRAYALFPKEFIKILFPQKI